MFAENGTEAALTQHNLKHEDVWGVCLRIYRLSTLRIFLGYYQRFRKGVGGRGLATNKPPKRAQKVLQKCVPILLRGA